MLGADRTGEIRRARFRKGRPTEGTCRDPGVSRARPAGRIRHRESACNRIVRNRLKGAGRRWSKVDANALLASGCRFENMRVPDFLEWRACRAAGAQPKKMDRTQYVGPSLLKNSVFHFCRLLALFGQNNNEEQCPEAEDGKSPHYFSRG